MKAGREIKFQVWDHDKQQMWTWDDIDAADQEGVLCFLSMLEQDQFIPRQFTGLHDKNGKEIYEGDIVKNHRRASTFGEELLQVIWQEAVIDTAKDGVRWTSEKPGFRLIRIGRGMTTVYVSDEDLEVIGNIYENPELLEVGS